MKSPTKSFDNTSSCASRFMMTSTIFLAFCFSANGLFAQESTEQPASPLKVMSFNVRYGTANDGQNHWLKRSHLVREVVQLSDPDLLGLQEAVKFQCEFFQEHFPDHEFFGRSRQVDPEDGEFCAIFFRRSRFEKMDGGHFWLSENPETPGSQSWDAALPRMATWVQLRDKQTDSSFIFMNTHYDHRGVEAREKSSQVIRDWIAGRSDMPIILTGDFNSASDSKPHQTLTAGDLSLIDSWRAIHSDVAKDEGTFGGWKGTRDGSRIDWILHSSNFTTLNSSINLYNDKGQFPSDHYPIQAILRIKP